jgi:hypothetical protein
MSKQSAVVGGIIGAVLGLVPARPAALLSALHATGDGSREIGSNQLLWAVLWGGGKVVLVCAAIGAGIGMVIAATRRPADASERAQARPALLISGALIVLLLLMAAPRLLLYPSLGTAAAWAVARFSGRAPAAWLLLAGGFLGSIAQVVQSTHGNPVGMLNYFFVWGPLGFISAILLGTMQAVGPALLLLGLGSTARITSIRRST